MTATAKIRLTKEKAIESAKVNLGQVEGDILTLKFNWNNKNTSEESIKKYTRSYLNFFDNMKRGFEIIEVTME